MPDPIAAPQVPAAIPANGAQPDWRASFAGEDATVLETLKPFEKPTDFLKSWQDNSTELQTLKGKPAPDWRKEIAGDDEKELKYLERYSSAKDYHKSNIEARNKIRSGELAKPLAGNATTEQIAEWRKANGIPEKAEGYFEKLPNGRVIGKDDLPLFNEVASKLHGHNISPAAMHDIVEWYYGMTDAESAKLSETEKTESKAVEDQLREAWGNDYRANENHLENYMAGLPEGLQKAFREGFGGDGKKLAHNAEFKQWMSNIAREHNPAGMITPGGNESQVKSIDAELSDLIKLSGNQHSKYWKGPDAARMQARHVELNAAKEKLAARGVT